MSPRSAPARDTAPARERRDGLSGHAVLRMQRTIGNAAVARLARAARARRVLARWPPNEEKVRIRAHELWQRRGGGHTSQEDADANYYEAQRQIAIEERAHQLSEERGGGDMVANYYDAEREIAAGRANGAAPLSAPKAPPPPPKVGVPAGLGNRPAAQPMNLQEALATRGALKTKEEEKPKEYPSATEGIEVENPVPFQVVLRNSKNRGVMAWVQDAKGEKLAEFTTDMGTNPYTIENRTTPCPSADLQGIDARKRALKMLADHIEEAAAATTTGLIPTGTYEPGDEKTWQTTSPTKGVAVKEDTKGDLTLKLKEKNHRVVPKSGSPRPGVQITKGVSFTQMLAEAPARTGAFLHAYWMEDYKPYFAHYGKTTPAATPAEATVFGMLASLVHFYLRRLDWSSRLSGSDEPGVGGKAVTGGAVTLPDMTQPTVKNPWGLLPKTPPGKWLSGLDEKAQGRVKQALRNVPAGVPGANPVNTTAWNTVLNDTVFPGGMIAGHAVPEFKIANETGFAFEIRTPKLDEKSGYGY